MKAVATLIFNKNLWGRLWLTTARRLLAYMSSRALATATSSSWSCFAPSHGPCAIFQWVSFVELTKWLMVVIKVMWIRIFFVSVIQQEVWPSGSADMHSMPPPASNDTGTTLSQDGSDWSCDLATLTFDLESHCTCGWCGRRPPCVYQVWSSRPCRSEDM